MAASFDVPVVKKTLSSPTICALNVVVRVGEFGVPEFLFFHKVFLPWDFPMVILIIIMLKI